MSSYYTGSTILVSLNIAHLDNLQFEILTRFIGYADSEDITNNTDCSIIPFVPRRFQNFVRIINISLFTVVNRLLDQQWVGLIIYLQATTSNTQGSCDVGGNHYLEHIIRINMTKSSMC